MLPAFRPAAAKMGGPHPCPPNLPNSSRHKTSRPTACQNVISRQPNSEGASQFHSCSTPTPMAPITTTAMKIPKYHLEHSRDPICDHVHVLIFP